MKLSTERILTTHVGSLPRPADLLELLERKDAGQPYDAKEFDRAVKRAVTDIVSRQVEAGIDVVSDGEMSKQSYATYVQERLTGFGGEYPTRPPHDMLPYGDLAARMQKGGFAGKGGAPRRYCVGPVAVNDEAPLKTDIRNFRAALDATPGATEAFMTAASPGVITSFQVNQYYPSHDAYLEAIAEAMRAEYEAIVGAGLILQLDCPDLAMSRHTTFQDMSDDDFLRQAEGHIEAINHALASVPAESVRMHICWGNYEGPHDCDIPLQKILPIILKAKPQAFVFEAANPRHQHEWAVWLDSDIPEDKVLIPGVIDSSTNYVEHPELVAQRIETYAAIVDRERVLAGSDCGFGTFANHGKVDPAIAFKKLHALAEGARIASVRLFA
jgi:5-methyltetrahydropteroyltriglutamate--homocysteine methyltransferase